MTENTSRIKKIKRVLEPIGRLTPRIKPRLKPFSDIQETHRANTGSWISSGSDPQFLCQFPYLELHTGWYLITIDIRCTGAFDVAKFYIDSGEGFSEKNVISIPYRSGIVAKRFVHLSSRMGGLRFDPQSVAGSFDIDRLSITPVTFKYAERRMLRKLTCWSASRLDATVSGAREALRKIAINRNEPYEIVLQKHYSSLFVAPVESHGYLDWIESVEAARLPLEAEIAALNKNSNKPLLSIIMPTCNTRPDWLQQTIDSVLAQSYQHWELCISDDASDRQETIDTIDHAAAIDRRIKVVKQCGRCGIANNTNAALAVAQGDFCLFLDHDDLLATHALHEMAKTIVSRPEVKLIYSDEDKLNEAGSRVDPHFKPDWNPDLLLAQNYICHLTAISRNVLMDIGFCRAEYDGAQDHDLLLRVANVIQQHEVQHIPQILYHWRMAPDSTASNADTKGFSTESGVAAVEDYLKSRGEEATVTAGKFPNTYRVHRKLTTPPPLVSIIIPTRDQLDILTQCIDSIIERTDYENYEIIVVDNRSEKQETLSYFSEIRRRNNIRVLAYDSAFNYSAINNFAVDHANGSVITLLNNDIEVISPEWLTEMVTHAIRPSIGCVGAKLLYKNNMVQHAGVILGIGGVAGHAHKYFDSESAGYFSRLHLTQNMSAVTAACLTVEKNIYLAAGGLNDSDLKVAFNDVDFCLRVRALGHRNLWTPYALLYHHESVSRGQEDTHEKQVRFTSEAQFMQKKWGNSLETDPAYNCNLTRNREDFSLAA